MRQLLLTSAHLITQQQKQEENMASAHRLLSILSSNSSPFGDSTQRLSHQFTKALSLRLFSSSTTTTTTTPPNPNPNPNPQSNVVDDDDQSLLIQSSYLSLNQITPFIRFTHLTANQAILDSIQSAPHHHHPIHILDFHIGHGLQWPPLMQAIADHHHRRFPPPSLRITATGHDPDALRRTGDRLTKFALSLGLQFQFHHILLREEDDWSSSLLLQLLPNETLAVNCVLYLHRLLGKGGERDRLLSFLQRIKSLNPRIVTVAEREADHDNPIFMQRFIEALDHYGAVFDSLEATQPPNSRERLAVEQVWLGREIGDIVAEEGERHRRYGWWEGVLRGLGFERVPVSPFAVAQAKLLLRLHYPSEGYQLRLLHDSLFLGWQNHLLFSVSSWQ